MRKEFLFQTKKLRATSYHIQRKINLFHLKRKLLKISVQLKTLTIS